jgi:hypothetical protein
MSVRGEVVGVGKPPELGVDVGVAARGAVHVQGRGGSRIVRGLRLHDGLRNTRRNTLCYGPDLGLGQ